MSCLRAAGERSEHPSHVAHFLGIEHLVENRENAPLFLSYSHGGHPFRMPPYLQCRVAVVAGTGSWAFGHSDDERLAALRIPAVSGRWIQGAGIALSPDGGKLAVALSTGGQSAIEVFDLAGGPVREWKAKLPGGNVIGTNLLGANALSWAADGRTLAFDAWGPARVEVHALDTAAPGTSLSASRLVMTFPHWSTTGSVSGSAIITPDGTKIIAMEVPTPRTATEIRVRQFSATTGRPLGILATVRYRKGAITGWPDVLWSNPSGSQLIISTTRLSAAPSKNGDLTPGEIGIVSGGRFVPLLGIPGGQRPVW
jgi:hypothetical protein